MCCSPGSGSVSNVLTRRESGSKRRPRGLPRRSGDRLRDTREGPGDRRTGGPRTPGPLGALRRGVDAISAGEPYLLDVRVATVGAGAESIWHQRFKLRQ
jgi:hypothetical protein